MWTRHFNVALVPELYVDDEKADGENDAENGAAGEDEINREVDLSMLDDSQKPVFWW